MSELLRKYMYSSEEQKWFAHIYFKGYYSYIWEYFSEAFYRIMVVNVFSGDICNSPQDCCATDAK